MEKLQNWPTACLLSESVALLFFPVLSCFPRFVDWLRRCEGALFLLLLLPLLLCSLTSTVQQTVKPSNRSLRPTCRRRCLGPHFLAVGTTWRESVIHICRAPLPLWVPPLLLLQRCPLIRVQLQRVTLLCVDLKRMKALFILSVFNFNMKRFAFIVVK